MTKLHEILSAFPETPEEARYEGEKAELQAELGDPEVVDILIQAHVLDPQKVMTVDSMLRADHRVGEETNQPFDLKTSLENPLVQRTLINMKMIDATEARRVLTEHQFHHSA